MRIFIVEDEPPAAHRLGKMMQQLFPETIILGKADSVAAAVKALSSGISPDVLFLDIHLADGLSFEIFNHIKITVPIIFTTAFDQYALKAFKVNSIDYLLKPIDETELQQAIEKLNNLQSNQPGQTLQQIESLFQQLQQPRYKERLLIKKGTQFLPMKCADIAYFFADDKLCYAVDKIAQQYLLEYTLGELEELLDPKMFFRINRGLIVHINSISKAHTWISSRLKLDIVPATKLDTVISRERVAAFKSWFGG